MKEVQIEISRGQILGYAIVVGVVPQPHSSVIEVNPVADDLRILQPDEPDAVPGQSNSIVPDAEVSAG